MLTVNRQVVRVYNLEFACTELQIRLESINVTLSIPWHGTERIIAESNRDKIFGIDAATEEQLFQWAIIEYAGWIHAECHSAVSDNRKNARPVETDWQNNPIPF